MDVNIQYLFSWSKLAVSDNENKDRKSKFYQKGSEQEHQG